MPIRGDSADANRLLALAREARLAGPDAASWVDRLTPEREGLLEAASWLTQNGEQDAATELVANVWRLWLLSGDVDGGRRLLASVLDTGKGRPSRARALALYGDGLLAFRAGARDESQARNKAALEVARTLGDEEAEALALVGLSRVALRAGDYARVRAMASEARVLTRDLDAQAGAAPLHMLAVGTRLAGDYNAAAELYAESLQLNREIGDGRGVATELHNLGHVELHRGNVDAAARCFDECGSIRNLDDPYERAMTDLNRAALAFASGDRELATELLRRMQATLDRAGVVLDPDDAFEANWLYNAIG
ncbi:MAG: hypothetical protein E6J14_11795 [Chloroflexi bacterium]|nr:MAG: hypothetical protein E6J14_11795 [Chloroflexota bacterium]